MITDDVCDYCDHEGCSDGRFCPFFTEFMGKDLSPKRKGKWLETISQDGEKVYKCSICGAKSYVPHKECPNCWNTLDEIEKRKPSLGKWTRKDDRTRCEVFICSECGGEVYSSARAGRGNRYETWCNYIFCPHCGKRMEVEPIGKD